MNIESGFPEDQRQRAAALYWNAFGSKLGKVLGPEPKAQAFLQKALNPTHAICALDLNGSLMGIAGFKTHKGALFDVSIPALWQVYGPSSLWRAASLTMLNTDTENRRFLMDGLFVAPDARGRGVGTQLLHALYDLGRQKGYTEIRLDVVDSNRRARALYEREGFAVLKTQHMGFSRHLFGFQSATTMIRAL